MRCTAVRAALILGSSLLLALGGCASGSGGDDDPTSTSRGAPAVHDPARPQRLDRDTRLAACLNGEDGATRRSTTVVLPLAYVESQALAVAPDGSVADPGGEVMCTFADLDGSDFPRPGRDFYVVAAPTVRDLAADARRVTAGPQAAVVEPARVLGQRGERATYAGADFEGVTYDVTSVQAGDVRLSRWAPTGRSAAEAAAADQAWAAVQASLAVRATAAADGDDDAESDDEAEADDTGAQVTFEASGPTDADGYAAALCAGGGVDVTLVVPDRLRGRGCALSRPGPESTEESIDVTPTAGAPLWEYYQDELGLAAEGGDDATSDLEHDGDVPGPGGLRAASLVYTYANDGVPQEAHVVQAGGVRLTWTVRPGAWGPQAEELSTVLASMAAAAG